MRLGREKNRTDKRGTVHQKWRLTPPEAIIDQLGWQKGDELAPSVENGALVLRRVGDRKA